MDVSVDLSTKGANASWLDVDTKPQIATHYKIAILATTSYAFIHGQIVTTTHDESREEPWLFSHTYEYIRGKLATYIHRYFFGYKTTTSYACIHGYVATTSHKLHRGLCGHVILRRKTVVIVFVPSQATNIHDM
ncbi:unnamed protein product [Cochlearia groenlandica]